MSLITNSKVTLDYEILERFEAGVKLIGIEAKSVRAKHGNLQGAYIIIRGSEVYLKNAFIPPYQENNTPKEYDAYRERKLMLNMREIAELSKAEQTKGLTVVPLSMYNKGRNIKVDIAIVRGKKKFDKRQTLKKRTTEREIQREFSDR
ncbi:MAG: SsrA-binding protein SmpB [Patescibacteria group bacterium]